MARRKRTEDRARDIQSRIIRDPLEDFEGNRFEYYLLQFVTFLRDHLKETAVVLGSLLLLVIAAGVYLNRQSNISEQGLLEYERLSKEPIMHPGSGAEARAILKLDRFETQFDTRDNHFRAMLKKMELFAGMGREKEAGELAAKMAQELDYPEQRAYFSLRAAIYYENAAEYSLAGNSYRQAVDLIKDTNQIKAVALFGEGRSLIRAGNRADGRRRIREMMEIKEEVNGIEELRIQAAAYLLTLGKKNSPTAPQSKPVIPTPVNPAATP